MTGLSVKVLTKDYAEFCGLCAGFDLDIGASLRLAICVSVREMDMYRIHSFNRAAEFYRRLPVISNCAYD